MRRLISLTSLAVCKDNAFDFEVMRGNSPMLGNELKAPYRPIFFLLYVFMQLCIEELLYRIKL